MSPPPPPQRGFILANRYRLLDLLGQGGMGLVYRADHVGLGVEVAVKIMANHAHDDPDGDLRFHREARLAAALHHPHAVRVFDFGASDGYLFLAMPLLQGETLRARLRRARTLPVQTVARLGAQVASALAAAHAVPLVHRDIKPDNVFLERLPEAQEHAVVMDFGLAVPIDEQGELTRHGEVFGTPNYMPPEQAKGHRVGPPADVYALGCVLFELLTGYPPFLGKALEVLTKHLVEPAPSLHGLCAAPLPPDLERLVARMLRKSPEERPEAGAVQATLERLAAPNVTLGSGPMPRLARMVDAALPVEAGSAQGTLSVRGGALASEIVLALRAKGISVVDPDADPSAADVVLLLGASPGKVAAWTGKGQAILADTDPRDMARMSELLRAGAHGVVGHPLTLEGVLKAVQRALRRKGRGR